MIRQRVSLAVAGAFAISSVFTLGVATPASAAPGPYDPTFTPTNADLVGGGSDTSEVVVDYLAKGTSVAGVGNVPGFNAKGLGRIASYAATGDATLTLRDNSTIARPKNSQGGRDTLFNPSNPNFDFARSSSSIAENEKLLLRQLPFAVDGVQMAVATSSHAPASISKEQVVGIYKGDITNWSAIGGTSGVIKPLIPPTGSGTRKFFQDQLKAANGGSDVALAPTVTETQEHSDALIKNDPDAVAPFSTGRAASAPTVKLVAGFSAKRALFNVVRAADIVTGAPKASLLLAAFGPNGFACSPEARPLIEAAGFQQLASTSKNGVCGEPTTVNVSEFKTSNEGASATTTTLSAAAANGGTVKLTADIASSRSPQGKVQFKEGATLLQTVNVAGGQAIASLGGVAVGAHAYSATFVPTDVNDFGGSASSTVTANVLVSSGVSVTVANGTYGVSRVITVSGTGGAANRAVSVNVPGVFAGSVQLANGAGTVSLPNTAPVGGRTVTATFAGDGSTFGSSASASLSITKAKTVTSLKLSKKIKANKKTKAKVTVKITGSALKATGKVTLKAGNKTIGKGTVKNGKVTITLKKLKKGSYKIKATFAGGGNYGASSTKTVKVKVS